jgi:hypothetical protein
MVHGAVQTRGDGEAVVMARNRDMRLFFRVR